MSTRLKDAAFSILALLGNTARPARTAIIISDAARPSDRLQSGDLHDLTGHHRYYGASARI